MVAPDRKLTEPPTISACRDDERRLAELLSTISDSSKQMMFEAEAYRLSTAVAREQTPPAIGSPAAHTLTAPIPPDEECRRPSSTASQIADDAETFAPNLLRHPSPIPATSSAIGGHRRRIALTLLAVLCCGGSGLTTAWALGLLDTPLLAVTSWAKIRHFGRNTQAGKLSDQLELLAQAQTGSVNEPLPLGISLKRPSGNETVVLDGVPDGAQLSLGTSLSASRWSLSAAEVGETFIAPPKDFTGTVELTAKLYASSNDELLDTKTIHFVWLAAEARRSPPSNAVQLDLTAPDALGAGQPSQLQPSQTKRDPAWLPNGFDAMRAPPTGSQAAKVREAVRLPNVGKPAAPTNAAALAPKQNGRNQAAPANGSAHSPSAEGVAALLVTGEALLQQGDISGARPPLQRAAEAGNAQAAIDLGMTFDPVFLHQIRSGIAPDIAQAIEWYGKAMDLGRDASPQLERLSRMQDAGAR
jgi:hypothetical protein